MQFQTIIAVLSLAFVATAVPTTPTTTVSQCNQSGGDLRCCNGKGTGGLLNLNLQCDLPIVNRKYLGRQPTIRSYANLLYSSQ